MGLFSSNEFTYKGYYIYYDKDQKLWYIRQGGRYGVNCGTSPDKAEAKRVVDALVK